MQENNKNGKEENLSPRYIQDGKKYGEKRLRRSKKTLLGAVMVQIKWSGETHPFLD